jgi:NDP-sugar pyrophosphorylase family protein
MKAMILAAGLGTRLRPLTNDRPKALVELAGQSLLEITLHRLRSLGIQDVVVNAHHFANRVVDYLEAHRNFGMNIAVSLEPDLLDTGGGLLHAAPFFLNGPDSSEPFLVHNVDILSEIDIPRMVQFHAEQNALATLAVQKRESSRQLLFDQRGLLCGRSTKQPSGSDNIELAHSSRADADSLSPLAFAGIHVLSPRIFSLITEEGAFSIIPTYLRLAAQGETIQAFSIGNAYWRDLGKPKSILDAAEEIASGKFTVPARQI